MIGCKVGNRVLVGTFDGGLVGVRVGLVVVGKDVGLCVGANVVGFGVGCGVGDRDGADEAGARVGNLVLAGIVVVVVVVA